MRGDMCWCDTHLAWPGHHHLMLHPARTLPPRNWRSGAEHCAGRELPRASPVTVQWLLCIGFYDGGIAIEKKRLAREMLESFRPIILRAAMCAQCMYTTKPLPRYFLLLQSLKNFSVKSGNCTLGEYREKHLGRGTESFCWKNLINKITDCCKQKTKKHNF